MRNLWWQAILFSALGVFGPGLGAGAEYPTRPIEMVVGYAPGGPTSLAARILSEEASKELGVPVVVVNKPGASGTIAATLAANSKPDGYTLLVATSANLSAAFALMPDITYKLSDFMPIAQHMVVPLTISVMAEAPWKTLPEFVADARKNPGKYKAGSDGGGISLTMRALLASEDLKVPHMVAKGGVPNVTALLSREIDISAINLTSVLPHLEAGKVRILAASLRWKGFSNFPTMAELGYDVPQNFWNGVFAPAGTPQPIYDKLCQVFRKVNADPAVAEKLERLGIVPSYLGPKEFGEMLQKEYEVYMRLWEKYKSLE